MSSVRCEKYIGDNDATSPQLTCIRAAGHPGLCDNVFGDYQVWALPAPDGTEIPVSFAYSRIEHAEIVRAVAQAQLATFWMITIHQSETAQKIDASRFVSDGEAIELFERLGW